MLSLLKSLLEEANSVVIREALSECYSDMFAFDGFILENEISGGYDTNGDLDHDYPIRVAIQRR